MSIVQMLFFALSHYFQIIFSAENEQVFFIATNILHIIFIALIQKY